jgi:hypothetical protein
VAGWRLIRTPSHVISYINILWKELTYARAWSAGRARPVEHRRTFHPLTYARNRRERSDFGCRRHGRTPSTPQAGEVHRPYPALSRFAPQEQDPLSPATGQHAPAFFGRKSPPRAHGCRIFLRWAPRRILFLSQRLPSTRAAASRSSAAASILRGCK